MKLRKKIRQTAFSAVLAALVTVLILLGCVFDMVDLACAAAASFVLQIALRELDATHVFLIYLCASFLSFILMPLRSASLYFAAFFGYYPLVRALAVKHLKSKGLYNAFVFLLYNVSTIALYLIFKGVFGVRGEPAYMYVLLLLSSNLFFLCFDRLIGRIHIIYDYKLKKYFKFK